MITFTLKGEVPSKKNNYRISKNGGLYKDEKVVFWEENAKADILEQHIPHLACKFLVHIILRFSRDRDLDNAVTSILDLLQQAKVLDNDKNVMEILAKKERSKKPGALVEIELI